MLESTRSFQILVVDPFDQLSNSLNEIFGAESTSFTGSCESWDVAELSQVPASVAERRRHLPPSSLLRHQTNIRHAHAFTNVAEQLACLSEESVAVDLLIYSFDVKRRQADLWELQSLCSAFPTLDIIVCAQTIHPDWQQAGERLEGEENVAIARTPLDGAELRQLALLLLKKRQLRHHLGRVCQEREQHLQARTRHLTSALAESRRLLSSIDLVLIEIDSNHIVKRWNQEAESLIGISRSEVIGHDIRMTGISWEDSEAVNHFLNPKDAVSSQTLEASFLNSEERPVYLGLTRHTIHHPDESTGILVLGVNLTEKNRLQQHLVQAQRLESVGQLAAGVAHEINTPMQYIGDNIDYLSSKFSALIPYLEGTMQLLQHEEDLAIEEKQKLKERLQKQIKIQKLPRLAAQIPDALSDSQQGLKHVSRIVRAMKELSHPGDVERTAVSVNHLIETAVTVSTNEWKYVADVELHLDASVVDILGFPGKLSQVFLNLIVNAAHSVADANEQQGREKGKVEITTCMDCGDLSVEVKDNGGGIAPEIRERIFDPFFTTKVVGKGTGQGLAIAHSVVVKDHFGRIDFQTSSSGTRFILHLPIEPKSDSEGQDQ